ncbi:TraM recognition domain-containing protein [Halobacillus sp. A5]|uniref:TraM recognition domain-containing protein n=1 Tax=Halobacillus sp. A5 TaxID=2880263 RepID=UPI0020A648AC|nr:TraM recognition domain-containing protein [Halobacillus sp. A5]MCP3029664.1 TraM recognition domain-containing protein [Halobacillus sp. A5]
MQSKNRDTRQHDLATQGKSTSQVSQELALGVAMLVGALIILPLFLFSLPFFAIFRIILNLRFHLIAAILGFVVFGFTMFFQYESYLGLYGLLPVDLSWLQELTGSGFPLTLSSYVLYVSGGLVVSYGWNLLTEYYRSKRVQSKEDEREKFKDSSTYEKTYKNRFKLNEKVQKKWRKQKDVTQLLLGVSENGKPFYQDFKEINQHMFLPATTGGGKTILLLNYIEFALMRNYPFLFIDGKGSKESIDDVKSLCEKYGKELMIFSDEGKVTYNPLKYGNATVIKDKLQQLIETESTYYTDISTSLVQAIIQFIDDYGFKRDLWTFSKFLDPTEIKKVLNGDTKEVIESAPYEEVSGPSDFEANQEGEEDFASYFDGGESEAAATEEEFISKENSSASKTITKHVRSERAERNYERFFTRYEHEEEGDLYLFSNASSVRTQIYLLLDSEIGHLFKESENDVDLIRVSENKEALFFSFDGLIYDHFIKVIARFLILDLNYLVSYRNRQKSKDEPFLAIYDEFSVYANDKIVDTINKSRSAGFHCIIATQMLADLEKIDPTLAKQVVGNTNTYAIGQTNHPQEVEAWANTLGTYKDVDLTIQTEKQTGRIERRDRKADQGSLRHVQKYVITPDEIRQLSKGQFIIARKASHEIEKPEIVYVRHPLKGL